MNRLLLILTLLVAPLCLADTPAPEAPKAPVTSTQAAKPDVKDQALSFILSKAEKYSGKVEDALGAGVDAAMREGPIVIKEYLTWKAWEAGIKGIGGMLLAIISLYGIYRFSKVVNAWMDEDNPLGLFGIIGCLSICVASACSAVPNLLSLVQIIIAPRVYLIEAASRLVH